MPRLDFNKLSPLLESLGKPLNPSAFASPQAPSPLLPNAFTQFNAKDQLQVASPVNATGSAAASLSLDPEPTFVLHTVKRGENLGKIAQKYLGNPNRHMEIYQANRDDLRNPNDLRIGMTLKIPVPATAVPAPEAPAPNEETSALPDNVPVTIHKVKRGESLSSIALDTLGDSERYMEIYQANRDILKSPDDLRLGMTLKIPQMNPPAPAPTTPNLKPKPRPNPTQTEETTGTDAVDAAGLTSGAQELLAAMQRYQEYHRKLGNTGRTKTTPAQMREIAKELDAASKAFGVDPKMMLALYAHESGGINPGARSHTGAGGLGQLTSIAIGQVHFMAGIGKGNRGEKPYTDYTDYKANFIQNTRSINQRYDIKANIWTSVAYMSYELNDRARLGQGVEKALKRYGDPSVPNYANKVNAEYKILFGGKLF